MKRTVPFLIVISICFMLCAPVFAAVESSPILVTLTAYCELNGKSCDIGKVSGIYLDNIFFVEPETLATITGYSVEEKSNSGARLLSHNRIRPTVDIISEENCIKTYIGDDTVVTPCPVQTFDKKPYVSFVHFMRYAGASFKFYKNHPIQLITVKRYDIFDAIGDMISSEYGYRFTWNEIDYGKDIKDVLLNAGLVAILGDTGIRPIKTLLNPDSIHEGILEDVLLTIVSTDCGSSTYSTNSSRQILYDAEGLATLTGSYPDYLEVYSQNIPSGISADFVKGAIGITSLFADTIVNIMNGIEISQRYDALIEEERTILQDTIVRFSPQLSDLVMGNNKDFKYVIGTAADVSVKAQDNAKRKASIREEIRKELIIDGASFALGVFDPFTTAINGAMSIYNVLPGTSGIIDKKTMLWNSYCSSVVQDLAFSIYSNHTTAWYQWDKIQEAVEKTKTSNSSISKLFSNYQMIEREDLLMYIKEAMLLQLRSTFITRQYLIASGSLDENAVNIQNKVCSNISELYCKISSCIIPNLNPDSSSCVEDLSWMDTNSAKSNYADSDGFGKNINQGDELLSEDKLAERFRSEMTGTEVFFVCDDFDGDGTLEAFGGSSEPDGSNWWRKLHVYYIDSYGSVFETDVCPELGVFSETHDVLSFGKKRLLFICSDPATGIGFSGTLVGVRNGEPYIPDGMLDLVYAKKEGTLGLHAGVRYWSSSLGMLQTKDCCYLFDETTGEFIPQDDTSEIEVVFDHRFAAEEYAIISGVDADGKTLWTLETSHHPAAQCDAVVSIGVSDGLYYYSDGGIVAVNLKDGSFVWRSEDSYAPSASVIGEDGTIYLCCWLDLDFAAIDKYGNTLARIDKFAEDSLWPDQIELVGDKIKITETYNDQKVFYVDRETYAVTR